MKSDRLYLKTYRKKLLLLCRLGLILLFQNAQAQVATVSNYQQLLTYNGGLDSVYVDHERYHGTFVKGSCSTTDFGTTFSTASTCWQRVFNNYSPRFWPIGSKSTAGQLSTIRSEADAINTAAYAAWSVGGDTIEIDKIYELDKTVWLLENNTYLGMADSVGFARIDPPKAVLIKKALAGDKKIFVDDNDGFQTFQKINISQSHEYDSIAGHISYTASVSTLLGGDTTIFLSGRGLKQDVHPGDSVSLFFPMMSGVSWARADNITLKNLVFEGNRDKYGINYDWRVNPTMLFPTNVGSVIDKCRFYNIPAENIFLCGTKVIHSSGTNFSGSALHFSCSLKGGPTEVLYNDFSQLNKVGQLVMQHSEAAFTFSARVRNFKVAYNKLSGLHERGLGMVANDDSSNVITDNLIETSNEVVAFRPFYLYPSTNKIYNNKNPNNADFTRGSCLLNEPRPVGTFPCNANSSLDKPLGIGDIIHITLDSLWARNTNNNFVKGIFFQYDNDYFELVGADMLTPDMASHHGWSFKTFGQSQGLVFDNGHKDGLYEEGNWGYEPCGKVGGCTNIRVYFKVKRLPAQTSAVPCPLEGLQAFYDSQMNTWEAPIKCDNAQLTFKQAALGQPVLLGSESCPLPQNLSGTVLNENSVRLNWDVSGDASAYLIWFKPRNSTRWKKVMSRDQSGTKTLKRLEPGTEYVWRVQGKCTDGWGSFSEEAFFTTSTFSCETVSFSGLKSSPVEKDKARLNWDFIKDVRPNLRWRETGTTRWFKKTKRRAFRHWLRGLKPASNYEWQIRGVCEVGGTLKTSAWSAVQNFTTAAEESVAGTQRPETTLTQPIAEMPAGIRIFPNPARDEVTIQSGEERLQHIRMIDLSGKVIVEEFIDPNENKQIYRLKLPGVQSGTYVILVYGETAVHYKKLIVN